MVFCSLNSYNPSCHKKCCLYLNDLDDQIDVQTSSKTSRREVHWETETQRVWPSQEITCGNEMDSVHEHYWGRVLQPCLQMPFLSRKRRGNEEIQKYSSHPSIWLTPPISELPQGVSLGKFSFRTTELHCDGHQTRALNKGLPRTFLTFL